MRGQHRCLTCGARYNRLAAHLRTTRHIAARTLRYGKGIYVDSSKNGPRLWQRDPREVTR